MRKESQLIRNEKNVGRQFMAQSLGNCLCLFRISDSDHAMYQSPTVRGRGSKPGRIQKSPRSARGMLRRELANSINGA